VQASRDLPVLMRTLGPGLTRAGLPFAVTAFVSEHGTQVALALIPLLSVLLPLMRLAPAAYNWTIRRRLLFWYRRLKSVEAAIKAAASPTELSGVRTDLEAIEAGVSGVKVPLSFSSQLYDLRMHVDIVRHQLTARYGAAGSLT